MSMQDSDLRIIISETKPNNNEQWNKLAEQCSNIWQATFYDEAQLFFNNRSVYFECYADEVLIGGVKIYFYESKKLPAIIRSISKRGTQVSEAIFDQSKNSVFDVFLFLLTDEIKKWLNKKKTASFYETSFYGEPEKLISLNENKKTREKKIGIAKIDLTKNTEELWKNINSKHRSEVIKAEKNKVTIEFGDNLDSFFLLLDETYKNQSAHAPNKNYLRKEYELLKANNSAQLVFAKHNEKYLSAALLYNYGSVSLYSFGGNSKNSIGSGQFLQWEIMKYLKQKNYQSYFLGETSFEKNDANLKFTQGITKFKLRFGAAQIPTFHKEYALYPMKLKIWKLLQKIIIRK